MACPPPGRVPGWVRGQQDLQEVSCHARRGVSPLSLVGSSLGDAKEPEPLRAVEGDSLLPAPGLGVCHGPGLGGQVGWR